MQGLPGCVLLVLFHSTPSPSFPSRQLRFHLSPASSLLSQHSDIMVVAGTKRRGNEGMAIAMSEPQTHPALAYEWKLTFSSRSLLLGEHLLSPLGSSDTR